MLEIAITLGFCFVILIFAYFSRTLKDEILGTLYFFITIALLVALVGFMYTLTLEGTAQVNEYGQVNKTVLGNTVEDSLYWDDLCNISVFTNITTDEDIAPGDYSLFNTTNATGTFPDNIETDDSTYFTVQENQTSGAMAIQFNWTGLDTYCTDLLFNGRMGGDTNDWAECLAYNYTSDVYQECEDCGNGTIIGVAFSQFHLNETSGTNVTDSSVLGNHGNTTNMEDADWVPGKLNNSLIFDGLNEYVTFGDVGGFERTDAFSFEVWFNTSTAGAEMLISKQENSGVFRGYNVFIESGKIKTGLINDNTGSPNRILKETTGTYNDGDWHHLVVAYDGSSLAAGLLIYIDGAQAATSTTTDALSGTILNSEDFQLSGRAGANVVYTGMFDEFVVYNSTINLDQVELRYNGGAGTESLIIPCNHSTDFPYSVTDYDRTFDMDNDDFFDCTAQSCNFSMRIDHPTVTMSDNATMFTDLMALNCFDVSPGFEYDVVSCERDSVNVTYNYENATHLELVNVTSTIPVSDSLSNSLLITVIIIVLTVTLLWYILNVLLKAIGAYFDGKEESEL